MATENVKSYNYELAPTQQQNTATTIQQDDDTAAPALKRKPWVPKLVEKLFFYSSS